MPKDALIDRKRIATADARAEAVITMTREEIRKESEELYGDPDHLAKLGSDIFRDALISYHNEHPRKSKLSATTTSKCPSAPTEARRNTSRHRLHIRLGIVSCGALSPILIASAVAAAVICTSQEQMTSYVKLDDLLNHQLRARAEWRAPDDLERKDAIEELAAYIYLAFVRRDHASNEARPLATIVAHGGVIEIRKAIVDYSDLESVSSYKKIN